MKYMLYSYTFFIEYQIYKYVTTFHVFRQFECLLYFRIINRNLNKWVFK